MKRTLSLFLTLLACPLWAHHGGAGDVDEFARSTFAAGWMHPWNGVGHWLIALGCGLWFSRATLRGAGHGILPVLVLAAMSGLVSANMAEAAGIFCAQALLAGGCAAFVRDLWPRVRGGAGAAMAVVGCALNLAFTTM